MTFNQADELFPAGERGEVLRPADCSLLDKLEDSRQRKETLEWLLWFRRNPEKYEAAVAAVRRIVERSGPGVAPAHMAQEKRHPPRGIQPVGINNCHAVKLARVARRLEADFARVFDFRKAKAADVLLDNEWEP
jgi:hypothetical protein